MNDDFKSARYLENTDTQQHLDELVTDISTNHRQILKDWYKANVAQSYEETKEIKPCDFTLNQQPVHEYNVRLMDGREVPYFTGYRYWFSRNTNEEGYTREEEREGALRITFAPEVNGMITDFEVHPRNIRKLIATLERAIGNGQAET